MKTVLAYVCGYCGTLSMHAPYIKGHEHRCRMNPHNRCCKSCRWWFKNRPEYGTRISAMEDGPTQFLLFCSNPDEDYSYEEDRDEGYFQKCNVPRENCEGWAAILQMERNMKRRIKEQVDLEYRANWDEAGGVIHDDNEIG